LILCEINLIRLIVELIHHIRLESGAFVDAKKIDPSIWEKAHPREPIYHMRKPLGEMDLSVF